MQHKLHSQAHGILGLRVMFDNHGWFVSQFQEKVKRASLINIKSKIQKKKRICKSMKLIWIAKRQPKNLINSGKRTAESSHLDRSFVQVSFSQMLSYHVFIRTCGFPWLPGQPSITFWIPCNSTEVAAPAAHGRCVHPTVLQSTNC